MIDVLSFFLFYLHLVINLFPYLLCYSWIGNGLLNRQCAANRLASLLLLICLCLLHHYFSRFANHVGWCHLLLSNHAVQSVSMSYDILPIGSLLFPIPHPLPAKCFVTVKKCIRIVHAKIASWPIIGPSNRAAAPIDWSKMFSSTNALVHNRGNWNVISTLPIR